MGAVAPKRASNGVGFGPDLLHLLANDSANAFSVHGMLR